MVATQSLLQGALPFNLPPVTVLILLAIVLFYLAKCFKPEPRGLPKGPKTWPIVGNLLMLDFKRPHVTLEQWAKKYGPVYRVYFGNELVIMLNDFESIKEAFCGKTADAFSGRPNLVLFNEFGGGRHGVVCSDGEKWKEQRRFTMSVLREFGIGRPLMEQKVRLEVDRLMQQLQVLEQSQTISNGVNHLLPINMCVANVISSLILGHSFSVGDREFTEYQRRITEFIQIALKAQPVNYFPVLQHIVPGGMGIPTIREHIQYIRTKFLRPKIQEHMTKLPESEDQATDFASAYLVKMNRMNGQKDVKHNFNLKELESIINDLFVAGHETTTTTLSWILLYILHYPDIQRRIHEEIDRECDEDDSPCWDLRNKLPLTMATIMEAQRLGNVTPLGVFHSSLEDVEFRDTRIPKGAIIMTNMYAAHMDERYFPEPKKFNPDRFIDAGTGTLSRADGLFPFSIGKRACLGESLARMKIFLIITSILQKYRLEVPAGTPTPTLDPVLGYTLSPHDYRVKLTRRRSNFI